MNTIDQTDWPTRFNAPFVGIALLALEFCVLIFPSLRDTISRLGAQPPPLFNFSFGQCFLIEAHPVLALFCFVSYHAASLRFFSRRLNAALNTILLLYGVLVLLTLGIPLRSIH